MFFKCFIGLLIVRLCFMSDIVLFIDWLYCIDLFSCVAASVFNKLTNLITKHLACWTEAQKGPGSNRSRDAVG